MTLEQMLRTSAENFPRKAAIVCGGSEVNYADLHHMVVNLATKLVSRGVGPSTCVAILLPNCLEFVLAFFATARLNATVFPLNPKLTKNALADAISDADVQIIITDSSNSALCESCIIESYRRIELIVLDSDSDWSLFSTDLVPAGPIARIEFEESDGDFLISHSSGSTGRPKLICRTQRNLAAEADNLVSSISLTSDDTILCVIPLFHAHGLGNCLLASVRSGATLVLLESVKRNGQIVDLPFVLRRDRVLELIRERVVTVWPAVPHVFSVMCTSPQTSAATNLRLVFSAGSFLPIRVFNEFKERFNVSIRQLYGCTEAGSISINLEQGADMQPLSIGIPLRNVQMKVVDKEGRSQPPGVVGEIAVSSPALATFYHGEAKVGQHLLSDGWFLTGDLGHTDSRGRFYLTAREKLLIDQGGFKVNPVEVAEVLLSHPVVEDAVVLGVPGPGESEIIKAVVVTNRPIGQNEILAYCREKMVAFKVPKVLEFRDHIPVGPSGKVLREELI